MQAEFFKTLAEGDCFSLTFSYTLHLVVRKIDAMELSKRLNNTTMVEHLQCISRTQAKGFKGEMAPGQAFVRP